MNFEKLNELAEQDRTPQQESNLERILDYLEEKITTNSCSYLTIEAITKENNLTNSEILELGANPSSLIFLMAIRLNKRMIHQFHKTYLFATGFTVLARIEKYLLSLYQFDIEHIKLRGAIHQYSWSLSRTQEEQINCQAMQLMFPIHLEFKENQIKNPDARCQAIWSLYTQSLRLNAIYGASAQECLEDIWDAVVSICSK